MKLGGVILAAGRSSRMGRDKALLPYGASTFLGSLIDVFRGRADPVIVVLGHNAERIRPAASGALVVINEDYGRGMLSSLQTGLRALPLDVDAAVFTLVDHPGLAPETLERLIQAFQTSAKPVVLPTYRGERGHPAIVSRAVIDELLALRTDASPKSVLRAHYGNAVFIPVDDPAAVADIDRPEDMRRVRPGRIS